MGCNVDPSIMESEKDVLRLDGVRFENHTVAGGGGFSFPCAGKIEVSVSRQAQGIAEQGFITRTGSTAETRMLGSFHGSSPCVRTCDESRSSRNWPAPAGGRPPQGVRRTAGHLPPPATFPPVVALADYHPALLDGEAEFLLAIQSDTQRRAMGLCAHTRDVPHGSACTRRTQSLRGRKE